MDILIGYIIVGLIVDYWLMKKIMKYFYSMGIEFIDKIMLGLFAVLGFLAWPVVIIALGLGMMGNWIVWYFTEKESE